MAITLIKPKLTSDDFETAKLQVWGSRFKDRLYDKWDKYKLRVIS